jgi:hypothetical protein
MVSGAAYRVHDVQHDGTGMTRLILMEDDE